MPTLRSVYSPLYFITTPTAETHRDLKPYLELEDLARDIGSDKSPEDLKKIENAKIVLDEVGRTLTDTIRISRELITIYRNTFEKSPSFPAITLNINNSLFQNAILIMNDLSKNEIKQEIFFAVSQVSSEIKALLKEYQKNNPLQGRVVVLTSQKVGTTD